MPISEATPCRFVIVTGFKIVLTARGRNLDGLGERDRYTKKNVMFRKERKRDLYLQMSCSSTACQQ
jgi:hypothetical protein